MTEGFKELAKDVWKGTENFPALFALAALVGLITYALLRLVTDPIHDALFLSHTIVVDAADDEREYSSWFWQVLGNSFALLTTLARGLGGYFVGVFFYRLLQPLSQSAASQRIWLSIGRPMLFGAVVLLFAGVAATMLFIFASMLFK